MFIECCRIEIFEDLPDVDNVLVPVGGGGLIGGIAAYLKGVNPKIKVKQKYEIKMSPCFLTLI